MKRLKEYILNCIEESILGSNSAGSDRIYFKTMGKYPNGYFSVLFDASGVDKDPKYIFDPKKIDDRIKKTPGIFKQDIPYVFNRYSKSTNKLLLKILCLSLACRNAEDLNELAKDILSYRCQDMCIDKEYARIVNGVNDMEVRIRVGSNAIIVFYWHNTSHIGSKKISF